MRGCGYSFIVTMFFLSFFSNVINAQGLSEAQILNKAAQQGTVRVIIKLNSSFTPEAGLAGADQVASQRNAISKVQSDVLAQVSTGIISNIKQFETIPYMALEVDQEALKSLLELPQVSGVEEDGLSAPNLLQSVPFVNGDDVINGGDNGLGFAIAVLDTGVRKTHIDLDNGKVVSEACYGTTSSLNDSSSLCPNGQESQVGSGAGVNCSTSINGCSHGTHVAGIAAGTYGGVAPGASIIAVQVFSRFDSQEFCGGSSEPCVLSYNSDQILGLERVYSLRNSYNIAAVNMSLGGGRFSSACDSDSRKSIIDNLRAANIATVISSGNNGYNGSVGAPSCISSAISVGSTFDNANIISSFSNHASLVDVLAPGSSITSSVATSNTSRAVFNGTSMAAPHVAGAFAVLRDVNSLATVTDIESALESSGVGISRSGISKPRINILGAANELTSEPSPDLIVNFLSSNKETLALGENFDFSATVRNTGTIASTISILRFYQSTDSVITADDTFLESVDVGGLGANGFSSHNVALTAPDSDGFFYFGACVDSVSNESSFENNCSNGFGLQVGTPVDDDFLITFIPAMIASAGTPRSPVVPRWSVLNGLCCSTSSLNLQVSQGSSRRSSNTRSCSSVGPESSQVESSAGTKSFSYTLSSSGCGTFRGGFNFPFKNRNRYVFVSELEGSDVVINVFSQPISRNLSKTKQNSKSVVDAMTFEKAITLTNELNESTSFEKAPYQLQTTVD